MEVESRSKLALTLALCVLAGAAACTHMSGSPNEQGWYAKEQEAWQRGSQGSRLIPYDWLMALEDAGSTTFLMSDQSILRFGYLPSPDNPTNLPVGFAVDRTDDDDLSMTRLRWFDGQGRKERWVGLNCAACHTAELTYEGHTLRIDGGPTLADFQGFIRALNASMSATLNDPTKWGRFAARVLAPRNGSKVRDTAENREALQNAFASLLAWQEKLARLNDVEIEYGPGRLDAVGHILNKIAVIAEADNQFAGPPDAPVSYPFIWNANQHNFVQWNGIAPNKAARFPSGDTFDGGALIRNSSEVIGVFADVKLRAPSFDGYQSSVNASNLDAMEDQLGRLKSPAWPAFMSLDRDEVARGKLLFERKDKGNCRGCHGDLDRNDLKKPIKAKMTPIFDVGDKKGLGTDPWMACNAFTYQAATGRLKGVRNSYVIGNRLGEQDFTRSMLVATSVGVLFGKKREIAGSLAKTAFGIPRRIEVEVAAGLVPGQKGKAERLRDCRANAGDVLMAYKGRPLNGIWATAPYLHNGSVKSLFELLRPPELRAKSFFVGNREFDAKHIGYVDAPAPYGRLFSVNDAQGMLIEGNSNLGHDYGNAGFSDTERYELVEYMKSL